VRQCVAGFACTATDQQTENKDHIWVFFLSQWCLCLSLYIWGFFLGYWFALLLSVYLGVLSGLLVRFVSLCISGDTFWGTGSLCFSLYIWGFFLGYWFALFVSVYLEVGSELLVRFVSLCVGTC
jgi:hypothetical protein